MWGMSKKEVFVAIALVVGVALGVYRFVTWEPASPVEDFLRNVGIPLALVCLGIRGILTIPDDPRS